MANKPLASFIINTYNHASFIEQAIESALNQTFPAADMEVIVVDDGSQDDTSKVAQKFKDRITLIRKENGGQSSALNVGFEHAKGEYLTLLDGDDYATEDRVEKISAEFDRYPEVGMIFSSMRRIGDDVDIREDRPEVHDIELSWENLETILRCSFGIGRTSLRKSTLQHVLPLPENSRIGADIYLLSMLWFGRFSSLRDHLMVYRYHEGNLFAGSKPELALQNVSYINNELNALLQRVQSTPRFDQKLFSRFIEPYELMRDELLFGIHLRDGSATRMEFLRMLLKQISVYRYDWSIPYRIYKYARLPLLLLLPLQQSSVLRRRLFELQMNWRKRRTKATSSVD